MTASAWLAKLNLSSEDTCSCGHEAHVHHHGKDCTALVDESRMTYCRCNGFKKVNSEEENKMAKTKKERVKKPKGEGRKPTLAPFVDAPFKIYMNTGGKEYDAQVLSSGVIKIDEKEFTSPSSAGSYILGNDKKGKPLQVDGWKSWYFNKDGERVMLNTLRGGKSPLKLEAIKPKREKKAKANGATKPAKKRVRKPKLASVREDRASNEQTTEATAF